MKRSLGETVAAAAGGFVAAYTIFWPSQMPIGYVAVLLLMLGMVLWIVIQDIRELTIPDGPVFAIGALSAAVRLDQIGFTQSDVLPALFTIAVDATLAGGGLFIVREWYYRRRGYDGIGFGDVKLAAACGIMIGISGFAWALLLASLVGLIFAGFVRLRGSTSLDRIPFGALLMPVCLCFWLFSSWKSGYFA